jgi:hypothetical protein
MKTSCLRANLCGRCTPLPAAVPPLGLASIRTQRTHGTMVADHQHLMRALAHDRGHLRHSYKGVEAVGVVFG